MVFQPVPHSAVFYDVVRVQLRAVGAFSKLVRERRHEFFEISVRLFGLRRGEKQPVVYVFRVALRNVRAVYVERVA